MLENLKVLLLQKLVLLPYQEVRLDLTTPESKEIIDSAEKYYNNKIIIIASSSSIEVTEEIKELPKYGVIAKIKSKIELPNGNYRVVIYGLNRVEVKEYRNADGNLDCTVKRLYIQEKITDEEKALVRTLKNLISEYMESNPEVSNAVTSTISNITDLDMLTDIITNFLPIDMNKKREYMNEFDYILRANNLIRDINVELEVINIENKVDDEIRENMSKENRDYILRQKISKLNQELGINIDKQSEIARLSEDIESLGLNEKTRNKLLNEVRRYSYTSENNPDSNVIRAYLDTVLSLPWNKYSKDELDLKKVKKNLDKSHFGFEEVKNRILEFIAIKKNTKDINSPILCLVGPPGTGKTTFSICLAEVLNREFIKISLGGLSDSAELTGHRRTYLGASPGKIIQGLSKCGTSNPVILLDEVDKIVKDYHGDPSAILLDILDATLNKEFVDNYIEEPFDLSKVLFVLTANDIKNIPDTLRDRLEIIEINSYTDEEKVNIAKKYILPRIIEEYNMPKIKISEEVLSFIVHNYTKEPGVRELERLLRKICRNLILNDDYKVINIETVYSILGSNMYNRRMNKSSYVGDVYSLGVTPNGGVIVPFEAIYTHSDKNIKVIGNVADSVQETTEIAYNYLLSNAKKYGIDSKNINNNSIIINALNYNIKKDGTSGGIAITTAIISLLLGKEVSNDICFSGEISLHGDIYPIGGVKEKLIGAYNAGYKKVYLPLDNEGDVSIVPDEIKKKLDIKFVSNYEEIFNDLFKKAKKD
ncbi:MAG: endopeptidase La [Bacilli bacterium]|nr:endopeptidase La [Bacilli bacterium]